MSRYLSSDITPQSTPSKLLKAQKSRQRREPSGVFSLFQPPQIQQFREAFSLIDHDGDGVISEQDLRHILPSLGMTPTPTILNDLLADRPLGDKRVAVAVASPDSDDRGITFPTFLTLMGEHLCDFDTEAELLGAFECFDEGDTGVVRVDEMRKWLVDVGERMDQREIDKLLKGPFTDKQGNFKYREWVKAVRINADTDETDSSQ